MSRNAAAKQFAVSVSCVVKLMQRFHRTGTLAPAARGKKPYALAEHEVLVRELVATQPDLTLDEMTAELQGRGIRASRSGVNRFLQACGLTFKKSHSMPPSSTVRMSPRRVRIGGARSRI
jgi:transposase